MDKNQEKNLNNEEELAESEYFTLTDEDGNELEFEVIGQCERNGEQYFAMIPVEDEDEESDVCEYIVLKLAKEGDEEILVTVDDDDELDDVADYFDDLFSRELDYDN